MFKAFKVILLVLIGFILGIGSAVGIYLWNNKTTLICTVQEDLTVADGIIIPKGTELIHDEAMSEGFDRYILYINMYGTKSDQKLKCRRDSRSFLIVPYWAD